MDPEMNPRHLATQSHLYNHREKDRRKENSGDQEKLSGQMQPRKPHARPQSPVPSQTLELSHSRALTSSAGAIPATIQKQLEHGKYPYPPIAAARTSRPLPVPSDIGTRYRSPNHKNHLMMQQLRQHLPLLQMTCHGWRAGG